MSAPPTLTVALLTRLSGLSVRQLRRLAAAGHLPAPVRGRYPLVPAIQGLLRYYREREQAEGIQDHYPTLAECAAATGIPGALLKQARRQACPGVGEEGVDLPAALPWLLARTYPAAVDDTGARAQRVALQNAKLRVELQTLRQELLPAEEVTRLGATLGQAIRKRVTRLHRLAPSLVEHPVAVIEARLREEEDAILDQLRLLEEHRERWRAAVWD